jgi:hypothetical protein
VPLNGARRPPELESRHAVGVFSRISFLSSRFSADVQLFRWFFGVFAIENSFVFVILVARAVGAKQCREAVG